MVDVARAGTAGMSTPTPLALSPFLLPRLLPPTPLPRIPPSMPSLTTAPPNRNQAVDLRRVSLLIPMILVLLGLHTGVRHLPAIFIPAAYTHRRCCRIEPGGRRRRRRGTEAIAVARREPAWRYETCWGRPMKHKDPTRITTC